MTISVPLLKPETTWVATLATNMLKNMLNPEAVPDNWLSAWIALICDTGLATPLQKLKAVTGAMNVSSEVCPMLVAIIAAKPKAHAIILPPNKR